MQGEMQPTCFSEIGTAPEAEQLFFKLFVFRKAGTQVFPVTMSCPRHSHCCIPFTAVYKRPLKAEEGLLLLAWAWAWAFGFCFGT
jgi:hypothetical protein